MHRTHQTSLTPNYHPAAAPMAVPLLHAPNKNQSYRSDEAPNALQKIVMDMYTAPFDQQSSQCTKVSFW